MYDDQGLTSALLLQEWRHQLRSSLHPILFAAVYRAAALLLRLFSVTPAAEAAILLAVPKVVQALFAAGLDFFTWRLAQWIFGPKSRAAWTIVCSFALD
jgi:phosphatidylinositol glycan class B